MGLLHKAASLAPPGFVRFIGRLQHRSAVAAAVVNYASSRIASSDGVITHGVGAGLRFDATGGFAGYLLGTSEPAEQAVLAGLLKPGDVFYDIGANIGFYATLAARLVGPEGRVCAFEPFAASAGMVERNAALNQFENVTVTQAAVAAQDGSLYLNLAAQSAQNKLQASDPGTQGVAVQAIAIDSWISARSVPLPSVVMIDVEGAELDVLRGMKQTLMRCLPSIMCEVHWLGPRFPDFVREELEPLGYVATTYAGGPLPTAHEHFHALLVVPDRAARVGHVSVPGIR